MLFSTEFDIKKKGIYIYKCAQELLILGTRDALKYIRFNVKNQIDEEFIKNVHLRVYGKIDFENAGVYRSDFVRQVGAFIPPSPEDVNHLMSSLAIWFSSQDYHSLHPIEASTIAHFQQAYIHPFIDGNGRTSRMLMNFILEKAGFPEVIVKFDERFEYNRLLQLCHPRHGGDTKPFIHFIMKNLEISLDFLINSLLHLEDDTHQDL